MPARLVDLRPRPESLQLHHGHSQLITGQDGVLREQGSNGLYHQNTRILSRWFHTIDGKELRFAAASAVAGHASLAYYLADDFKQQVPGLEPEESGLAIRVSRFVGDGLHEDVDLENFTQAAVTFEFGWQVAADFADLAEAVEGKRQQCAAVAGCWTNGASPELVLRYTHPRLDRAAAIRFDGASDGEQREDGLAVRVSLAPGERRHFCAMVAPRFDSQVSSPSHGCYAFAANGSNPAATRYLERATRLRASNAAVQAAWDHAVSDLAELSLGEGGWPEILTPAAGIPEYQSLFGRDVLTTAWQAAMVEPVLMEATLAATAARLGSKQDDFFDEQPGRIVQQVNRGPLAALGITPMARYYGDYAAPCDFLIILGQYFAWTGDTDTLRKHHDAAERVLDWLDREADADGDGFIEYDTRSPKGTKNQGWKDSGMALVYEDGRGVPNPIAACELQGYLYAAKQQYAAALATGLRRFGDARRRLSEASELKRRFNDSFWMPEDEFIAFALDPHKRQVKSISSNAGHCLATGIVDGEHAGPVASRLMARDMFSGWGVRTLSSDHPSFNPFSYHLGSVWPVEQGTIAFGLKRYGFHQLTCDLAKAVFEAAGLFPHHRLPEVIGGCQRDAEHPHPGLYPQAQLPQAWSASAVPLLLQAMLALRPFAPLKCLFIDPVLPEWLSELRLSNLRVGDARLSLHFHRERDGTTGWKVTERRGGTILVIEQPADLDVGTSLLGRAAAIARSFVPFAH